MLLAGAVRGRDVARDRAFRDAVALGDVFGHRALLALERGFEARLDRAGHHRGRLEKGFRREGRQLRQAVEIQG